MSSAPISATLGAATQASAQRNANIQQSHRVWAPSHLTSRQIEQLGDAVWKAADARSNGHRKLPGCEFVWDLGYTFSLSTGGMTSCVLEEVARRFVLSAGAPRRVRAVDVGSGWGTAAWQLLVAGAHVDCIEQDADLARNLPQELSKAFPFLRSGETVATCSRMSTKAAYWAISSGRYATDTRWCSPQTCCT